MVGHFGGWKLWWLEILVVGNSGGWKSFGGFPEISNLVIFRHQNFPIQGNHLINQQLMPYKAYEGLIRVIKA